MCTFQWTHFHACTHVIETRVPCYYYTRNTFTEEPALRCTNPSSPPSSPSSSSSSSSTSSSSSSYSSTATVQAEPKEKSWFLSPPYTCETWNRRPRPLLEATKARGPELRAGMCPACIFSTKRKEAEIRRKERELQARSANLETWRGARQTIINQGREGLGRLAERMRDLGVIPGIDNDGDDEDETDDEDDDSAGEDEEDDGLDLTDEEIAVLDLNVMACPPR